MKHCWKRVLAVLLALAMAVPSNVLADGRKGSSTVVEQTETVPAGETTIEKQGEEAQEAGLTVVLSATRADYDGTDKRPTVTVKYDDTDVTNNASIQWKKDGVELSAVAEFIEAGTYNLTVTYESATKTATFQIGRAKISDMEVLISDQAYTGFAITPDPADVTFTDSYGTTYNATYEITSITNNTNVGQASVNMTGTGNFIGSANARFNIVPASFDNVQINTVGQSFVIGNGQFVPELVSIKLGEYDLTSNDYTLSYATADGTVLDAAPTTAGTYKMIFAPGSSGSFTGNAREIPFEIKDAAARIGEVYYASLEAAVAAAAAGDTVEIIAAGTYTLPNISQNITIKGNVAGVVFSHTTQGSVCSIPNGVTFQNVTFNFGNANYHGFQHAGLINMEDCTINGKLFSYGDMNFTGCTFNAPGTAASGISGKDYSMWAYGGNVTYTNCTFNGAGKFINVYNESGTTRYVITASGCTFNSSEKNKAAFNVKESSGSNVLQYTVNLSDNTINENFPEASESDALTVISGLVQVDDRIVGGTLEGGEIVVNVDGEEVYSTPRRVRVCAIGDVEYVTLEDAINAAQTGDTIIIYAGTVELPAAAVIPAGVTLKGQGADQTTVKITTTNGSGVKLTNPNITIRDLKLDGSAITSGGYNTLVNVRADGCVIDGVVMRGGGTSTWNSLQ